MNNCRVTIKGVRDGYYYTDVYEFNSNKSVGKIVDFSINYFKECHKFATVISVMFERVDNMDL